MKRFIPLLLVISIFICCMVVPVAAESQDEYYFPVESPYYELDETSVTGSYYSQDMHIGFMTFQDLTPGGTSVTPTASRPGDYIGRPLFTTAGVNSAQEQRIVFASRPFTLPYNSNAINQFVLDFDFLSSNMSGFGDMYTVTLRFTDINGKNWNKVISGSTNSVGQASVSFSTEFDPTNPGYVYIPVDAVSWRVIVDVRSTPRTDNLTGTSIHDPLSIYQFSSNVFWQWDLDLIRVSFVDYALGQIKQDTDFISNQTQIMMNKFQGLDLAVSVVDSALERVDVYVVDSNNKLVSIQSSVGSISTSIDQLTNSLSGAVSGISGVSGQVSDVQTGVSNIQTGVGNVQSGVNNLQTGVGNIQTDVGGIKAGVAGMQNGILDMNQNFGILDDMFGTIDDDNKMLIEEVKSIDDGYTSMNDSITSGLSALDDRFSGGRYDGVNAGVGDLTSMENTIFDSINGSLQNAEHYFTGGLDSIAPYGNAMLAYTSMFNRLITEPVLDQDGHQVTSNGVPVRKNNVFGDLLTVSLALGALVAILNIAVHASSVTQAHERLKVAEAKRDMRSAMGKQRR